MQWSFAKYVGCGNDFILFDNRQGSFPLSSRLIANLCHRQKGIGGDGLILLENSIQAHFRMRIFNSDGSEAEMCGNGLRCFVDWIASLGFVLPLYEIETLHRKLTALKLPQAICIAMGTPTHVQWNIPLNYQGHTLLVHHLNTGVPHTIVFVAELDNMCLIELGRYIRYHAQWQPYGTNVTFAQQIDHQTIQVRTYERGVEGETQACGTGAVAAALAAAYQHQLSSPITVQTRSREALLVEFVKQADCFSNVTLTGPAHCVFQGKIDLHSFEQTMTCATPSCCQ